jgi:hypothetical protein
MNSEYRQGVCPQTIASKRLAPRCPALINDDDSGNVELSGLVDVEVGREPARDAGGLLQQCERA